MKAPGYHIWRPIAVNTVYVTYLEQHRVHSKCSIDGSCHRSLIPLSQSPSSVVTSFLYVFHYRGEAGRTGQVYGPSNGYVHLGLYGSLLQI